MSPRRSSACPTRPSLGQHVDQLSAPQRLHDAKQVNRGSARGWSAAEWGLRWLCNQPEVTVVLSGMNSLEMARENCRVASEARTGEFTEADFATLAEVSAKIREKERAGCTGCRYCMPCPKDVDIPGAFRCYNAMYIESKSQGRFQHAQTVGLTKEPAFASQCIECGKGIIGEFCLTSDVSMAYD